MAHQVLVMRRGRVVEEGPVEDIFRKPKHPYTKALISAAFDMRVKPVTEGR
jgi:oligopeptide/dipeptide ABC transporter ATP-binding protein